LPLPLDHWKTRPKPGWNSVARFKAGEQKRVSAAKLVAASIAA